MLFGCKLIIVVIKLIDSRIDDAPANCKIYGGAAMSNVSCKWGIDSSSSAYSFFNYYTCR